ncbi:trypsin 3A1-like [Scylla paramamosain]|uniref:trypsin 3A1-like n=1 Tax=Scylla paramamosain TaxID=85552 RepID=UPI0030839323
MQLCTFAILCGATLLALGGCPVQGRATVMLKMRDSCDGKCLNFTCGTPNRGGRVVGGNETAPNEYPWIVAFYYSGKLYCSGSLVNDRYIITAAHCVRRVAKHKITLIFGSHNKTIQEEKGRQVRKIDSVWYHPSFQRHTYNNDLGIIKLDVPVEITKFVRPICLPSNSQETYEGSMGIVAGWGRTDESGNSSDVLRYVKVPIMTNTECKTKKYRPREITENMMCAGYDAGKIDACQGDSGGPLMYKNGSRIELIGVVSWGEGCARPGYPGVYTRISMYWTDINRELNKEKSCSCPEP